MNERCIVRESLYQAVHGLSNSCLVLTDLERFDRRLMNLESVNLVSDIN